jgi:hypothetical protein
MIELSETDVREMLERRASALDIAPVPSHATLRMARRRKVRHVVLASVTTLAAVALAGHSVTVEPASDQAHDSAKGGDSVAGDPASPAAAGGHLRLVDYAVHAPAPAKAHPDSTTGPTITLDDLRRHASCMRSQGFDVPKPAKQPGGGWAVILHPARARELSFGSRAFRTAWFVTCGPLGGPLSGDLIVGGPRLKIDRFMSCMSREGFSLPEPTKDTSGHYDSEEWQFDLTRTSIDTSTPAWNRAMFVTCAPADI